MIYDNVISRIRTGYTENQWTSGTSGYAWVAGSAITVNSKSKYYNVNLPSSVMTVSAVSTTSGHILDWTSSQQRVGLSYAPAGDPTHILLSFLTYETIAVTGITTSGSSTILWIDEPGVIIIPTPYLTGDVTTGSIGTTSILVPSGGWVYVPPSGDIGSIVTPTVSSSGSSGNPFPPSGGTYIEGPLWGYRGELFRNTPETEYPVVADWMGLLTPEKAIMWYKDTTDGGVKDSTGEPLRRYGNTIDFEATIDTHSSRWVYTQDIVPAGGNGYISYFGTGGSTSAFYDEYLGAGMTVPAILTSSIIHYLSPPAIPANKWRVIYYHNFSTPYTGEGFEDYDYKYGHWKGYSFDTSGAAWTFYTNVLTGFTTGATSGSIEGPHTDYDYVDIIPIDTPGSTGMPATSGYIKTGYEVIKFKEELFGFTGGGNLSLQIDPLIRRWLRSTMYQPRESYELIDRISKNSYPSTFDISTESYIYFANIAVSDQDMGDVTVATGALSVIAKRAYSLWDFFNEKLPTWIPARILEGEMEGDVVPQKIMYLRNLESSSVAVSATDGYYTISIHPSALMEDAPIWKRQTAFQGIFFPEFASWVKEPPETIITSGTYVKFKTDYAVTTTAIYKSKTLYNLFSTSGTVYYKLDAQPLRYDELYNHLDSMGSPFGIKRIDKESNKDLRDRILSSTQLPKGMTSEAMPFTVGLDLGLTSLITWNGLSTVNLITSGHTGIVKVYVSDVPEKAYYEETLTYSGSGGVYYSQKKNWSEYSLYYNGELATTTAYPNLTALSGTINFNSNIVSGTIIAKYSVINYTLSSIGNYIAAIIPTEIPSGTYYIGISSVKTSRPLNLATFLEYSTAEVEDIRYSVEESMPITLGTASWGNPTKWFETGEVEPNITNISAVFQ